MAGHSGPRGDGSPHHLAAFQTYNGEKDGADFGRAGRRLLTMFQGNRGGSFRQNRRMKLVGDLRCYGTARSVNQGKWPADGRRRLGAASDSWISAPIRVLFSGLQGFGSPPPPPFRASRLAYRSS